MISGIREEFIKRSLLDIMEALYSTGLIKNIKGLRIDDVKNYICGDSDSFTIFLECEDIKLCINKIYNIRALFYSSNRLYADHVDILLWF